MKKQSIILCCLFSITAQPVAARYINNFGDGLGVNIKTERITEAELNDIARLKFKRVRISITWPNVAGESENAQFSWNNPLDREKNADNYKAEKTYTYDDLISKAVNLGLHLDVTLDEGSESPLPIDKIDGFAKFAAATVHHFESNPNYKGAFSWHIWNEPNLSKHPDGSFANTAADAAIFGQVMSKTCTAIRNTESNADIMGPALGSNDDNIDYKYIDGLFSGGYNPLECINAFTIHPYRNIPPETVAFDDWEIKNPPLERADYPTVAQHLAPHQPPNTQVPVAVDEIGYDAVSNNANDPARNWRQIVAFAGNRDNNAFFSAYEQAALIFRVYLTNIAEDIPLTVIYDWRDWGNNPKNYQHTYGITGFYYDKKPAYKMISTSWSTLIDRPFLSKVQPANCDGNKVHWLRFGELNNNDTTGWSVVWTHDINAKHILKISTPILKIIDIFGHLISVPKIGTKRLPLTGSPILIQHDSQTIPEFSCDQ